MQKTKILDRDNTEVSDSNETLNNSIETETNVAHIEELNKVQDYNNEQLKNDQTITDYEEKTKKSGNINLKKSLKIIIPIIAVIVLIVAGIFVAQMVSTNQKIKETEKKLREIDVEELESSLIGELSNTKLKVEIDPGEEYDMFIGTMFIEGVRLEDYICADVVCMGVVRR